MNITLIGATASFLELLAISMTRSKEFETFVLTRLGYNFGGKRSRKASR